VADYNYKGKEFYQMILSAFLRRSLVILALLLGLSAIAIQAAAPAVQTPQYPQQQSGQAKPAGQAPAASDGEIQAAKKVQSAADPAAALQAADEFVKKYPKSALMKNVAQIAAAKIAALQDPTQKITFSETYQNTFKGPEYDDIILPILIDGYAKGNRPDDAFQKADGYLQRHPEDLPLLTQIFQAGVDLIKHRNPKYVAQTQKYGAAAIALIEAGKKPDSLSDADWGVYKNQVLPQLYQSMGLLAVATGNEDDARAKLNKALSLNPADPFSYVLLGSIANNHYQALATQYKSMVPGADQDATLKKALDQMDQVIDYFARAVALSEGNPQYKQLHDQVFQELEGLYKYRHKGADGLQQLIDKYKKPANG
jgi:hypothetical protein